MSGDNADGRRGFEIPPRPPLPTATPNAPAPVRRIGMPPGMEPALDTVPSSDHSIPVPVARPEFGVAPTPPPPAMAPGMVAAPVAEPPSGPRLELPDGSVLSLEHGLIVGRDPQHQDGYGVTELARLHDVERSVSKTHAILGISGGTVWVLDLNSTNGTVLIADDGTETLCTPEVATTLPANTAVRFGEYRVQFAVD